MYEPSLRELDRQGCGPGSAARGRLKTLIVNELTPAGTLLKTETIEDYPGFEEVTGPELAQRMEAQARKFAAEIKLEDFIEPPGLPDASLLFRSTYLSFSFQNPA